MAMQALVGPAKAWHHLLQGPRQPTGRAIDPVVATTPISTTSHYYNRSASLQGN